MFHQTWWGESSLWMSTGQMDKHQRSFPLLSHKTQYWQTFQARQSIQDWYTTKYYMKARICVISIIFLVCFLYIANFLESLQKNLIVKDTTLQMYYLPITYISPSTLLLMIIQCPMIIYTCRKNPPMWSTRYFYIKFLPTFWLHSG